MGRTLFKQALCQWKVDGCLSGLSPFLGFCCFVCVFAFFFFKDIFLGCVFFLGGMLIGFCWDWIVFLGFGVDPFFLILMVF